MEHYTEYKWLIILIKYGPIIGGLFMMWYVALLLLGYLPLFAHWMFGFSLFGASILLMASNVLHFCKLHKSFIIYDTITEICINFLQLIGFGETLIYMRWVVFIAGLILFAILIYKQFIKKKWCRVSVKDTKDFYKFLNRQ